jgi:hypothetical protein
LLREPLPREHAPALRVGDTAAEVGDADLAAFFELGEDIRQAAARVALGQRLRRLHRERQPQCTHTSNDQLFHRISC